jgi:hypothetical protein
MLGEGGGRGNENPLLLPGQRRWLKVNLSSGAQFSISRVTLTGGFFITALKAQRAEWPVPKCECPFDRGRRARVAPPEISRKGQQKNQPKKEAKRMKQQAHLTGFKKTLSVLLAGTVVMGAAVVAFGAGEGGPKIGIIGDHRGDNSAGVKDPVTGRWSKLEYDETTGKAIRFKDHGINRPVLVDVAKALKAEGVDLVLDVGDLATKHIVEINGRTPDELLTEELTEWGSIWNLNSGNLPIFPVRGNQEVLVPGVWKTWIKTMPGIGEIAWNGPAGEEGLTFSFTYKNCLIVGIDQYMPPATGDVHLVTPNALAWLNDVLKAPNKPFKFVYGHTPAFEVWNAKKGAFVEVKDGLANPLTLFSYDYNGFNYMAMRDLFWDLVGENGATYYCGHDHLYARALAYDSQGNWVRQVIMGNGGAPVVQEYAAAYNGVPFAEAYARSFPTRTTPPQPTYKLTEPRVATECFPAAFGPPLTAPTDPPKNYGYGYLIVDVQGSKATARYMAEPKAGAGFKMMDTWQMKAENNQGH